MAQVLILAVVIALALIIFWSFIKTVIGLGIVSVILFGGGFILGYWQGRKGEGGGESEA
jgi:hypothetical protein